MRSLLAPDKSVRALVLFGSWASPDLRDEFSDVDLLLVTADGQLQRFFPSAEWLAPIGAIFAIERSLRERHGVLRMCFEDMRRMDIIVVEESTVAMIGQWDGHPLRTPRTTVFSRSPAVDRAVATIYEGVPPRPFTEAQFAEMIEAFWFVAQLAVHKAVRRDLLVATHLSLELTRRCLEMAMHLRDRAAGTHVHRHGAESDIAVLERLKSANLSAESIIDAVERCGSLFDDLAHAWDPHTRPKMPLLQPLIAEARSQSSQQSS
jgi:predicted nucleotidyltransferase